jgi:uncharacterized protein Yka (UPF0111/DUF47 family)
VEKREIIEELGESDLLLPDVVNSGLLANDRVKYLFTLLQTARAKADNPNADLPDLAAERKAAEVENPEFDSVVGGSIKTPEGDYQIPLTAEIFSGIAASVEGMMRPLGVKDPALLKLYRARFNHLVKELQAAAGEPISGNLIDRITSGERGSGQNSLHVLVMDLHKELNAMQAELATEVIEGAHTYLLKDKDRDLVRAFMTGVNRNSPLRFDHPGLGTTATRSGARLIIQNDIGMTDAHVMVITIAGLVTTITYTDVHLPRLQFLRAMLSRWDVKWNDTVARPGRAGFEKDIYHLAIGQFTARDKEQQKSFLEYLGSRLVFLIDWNRARKALREFLPKNDAIAALRWAADNDIGHMAFLRLGGAKLVHEALEVADPLRYREPLHEILSREEALEYIESVLRIAAVGSLARRSRLLINDEIRTELLRHFRSGHQALLERCAEQGMLITDVAISLRDTLLIIQRGGDRTLVTRNAERSKRWERESDDLVNSVRTLAKRTESADFFAELLTVSDDALDYLEEASYFTTLAQHDASWKATYEGLVKMAQVAVKTSEEYLKALYAADYLQTIYAREELADFLDPIDRVLNYEREADEAYRAAQKHILEECTDFKQFWVLLKLASNIEKAVNGFMRAVYVLRDYVLENASR